MRLQVEQVSQTCLQLVCREDYLSEDDFLQRCNFFDWKAQAVGCPCCWLEFRSLCALRSYNNPWQLRKDVECCAKVCQDGHEDLLWSGPLGEDSPHAAKGRHLTGAAVPARAEKPRVALEGEEYVRPESLKWMAVGRLGKISSAVAAIYKGNMPCRCRMM